MFGDHFLDEKSKNISFLFGDFSPTLLITQLESLEGIYYSHLEEVLNRFDP